MEIIGITDEFIDCFQVIRIGRSEVATIVKKLRGRQSL